LNPVSDVYSYEEDEMVEDPHLAKHLAHFGINMMKMEKVCKVRTGPEKSGKFWKFRLANSRPGIPYGIPK
jgi:hypothetical protein